MTKVKSNMFWTLSMVSVHLKSAISTLVKDLELFPPISEAIHDEFGNESAFFLSHLLKIRCWRNHVSKGGSMRWKLNDHGLHRRQDVSEMEKNNNFGRKWEWGNSRVKTGNEPRTNFRGESSKLGVQRAWARKHWLELHSPNQRWARGGNWEQDNEERKSIFFQRRGK